MTLRDQDKALKNCYRSSFGFPKFGKKGKCDSFRSTQCFHLDKGSIKLSKIRDPIRINKHTPLGGRAKHLTISKESRGRWYVSVCVEFEPKQKKKTGSSVGIDLGTKRLATLRPSERGELEITDVNNVYIQKGSMTYEILDGWWTDAGTFDSLRAAGNLVSETGANKVS